MPRYRATATLFVNGARIRPGQEFISDLPPAPAWELMDAATTVAPGEAPVDGFAAMQVEELMDYIETKTGRRPAKASRPTLLRQAREAVAPVATDDEGDI